MVVRLQDYFRTSDTSLAAWLVVSNVRLVKTDNEIYPTIFYFEEPVNGNLEDIKLQWESGVAFGNCSAFYKTYRYLVRQVKEHENGQR